MIRTHSTAPLPKYNFGSGAVSGLGPDLGLVCGVEGLGFRVLG